jgi:K+-transporting ATPase ATPase C chain
MMEQMLIAIRATLVTLVLTGFLYPFAMTGVAQVLFPWRAGGSLITDAGGRVIGSELIGYDATASSGSNLGPTSQKLRDRIAADVARLQAAHNGGAGPVPGDLVTTSASGLDPHLTPGGALWQVARVARARGVAAERVRSVVEAHVEGRTFGLLGEPRVNVLKLNLALDRQFGRDSQ